MLEVVQIPCECGQHLLTFLAVPVTPAIQTPYVPPSPGLRRIVLHKSFGHGALGGAS